MLDVDKSSEINRAGKEQGMWLTTPTLSEAAHQSELHFASLDQRDAIDFGCTKWRFRFGVVFCKERSACTIEKCKPRRVTQIKI